MKILTSGVLSGLGKYIHENAGIIIRKPTFGYGSISIGFHGAVFAVDGLNEEKLPEVEPGAILCGFANPVIACFQPFFAYSDPPSRFGRKIQAPIFNA